MDTITVAWVLFNTAIGGAVSFYLFSNWKTLDVPRKIVSLLAIFTPIHQIEEYVIPGGFPIIFNLSNDAATANLAYPLNTLSAMTTNTVALLLIVFVLWKFANKAWATLFAGLFGLGQVAIHVGLTITSLELFGSKGQTLPYSPGLFTSIVLYLPLGVFCIVYLIIKRSSLLINAKNTLKTIGIAFLAMVIAGGTIIISQMVFRNPDTTFVFENRGFYGCFLNE